MYTSTFTWPDIYIPSRNEDQILCANLSLRSSSLVSTHIHSQWRRRFKTFSRYEHTTRTFLWRSFTLRTVHVFIFIRLYLRLGCTVNVITFIELYLLLFVRAYCGICTQLYFWLGCTDNLVTFFIRLCLLLVRVQCVIIRLYFWLGYTNDATTFIRLYLLLMRAVDLYVFLSGSAFT